MPQANEPPWAELLNFFYNSNVPAIAPATIDPDSSHIFIRATTLDPAEAAMALQYLWHTNLIERIELDDDTNGWRLTKPGFEVAHQREMRNGQRRHEKIMADRQQKSNYAIVFLTAVLALATIAETLVLAATSAGEAPSIILTLGVIPGLIFLAILVAMYHFGYFQISTHTSNN